MRARRGTSEMYSTDGASWISRIVKLLRARSRSSFPLSGEFGSSRPVHGWKASSYNANVCNNMQMRIPIFRLLAANRNRRRIPSIGVNQFDAVNKYSCILPSDLFMIVSMVLCISQIFSFTGNIIYSREKIHSGNVQLLKFYNSLVCLCSRINVGDLFVKIQPRNWVFDDFN